MERETLTVNALAACTQGSLELTAALAALESLLSCPCPRYFQFQPQLHNNSSESLESENFEIYDAMSTIPPLQGDFPVASSGPMVHRSDPCLPHRSCVPSGTQMLFRRASGAAVVQGCQGSCSV